MELGFIFGSCFLSVVGILQLYVIKESSLLVNLPQLRECGVSIL